MQEGLSDFWTEVEAAFEAAIAAEPSDRYAVLDAHCANRPDVRAEVESLLLAHEKAGTFLGGGSADGSCEPRTPSDCDVGLIVGAYRLVEKIGEGGMGEVYRAERADGAFAHQVAVKVTRGALTDADGARRFRAERQILASLHHPHIVTLIDGGTLASGHAYLVMELLTGTPVTAYCRAQSLGLPERLRLMRQICSAVHYAHRHGVVHRDLKPANVLVTPDGVLKVLDFGIAKLLAEPTEGERTKTGVLAGPLTPNYASPEQLRGMPVTTASDIYALGVVLYELVAAVRPYETTNKPLDEVLDLVVKLDPRKPSAAAESRGDAASLPYDARLLRGDVDAIAGKALAKEPEGRYASAEELSDDIARFLGGQPILAREPSFGYLVRKLAGRHRLAVSVASVALVAILVSLSVALWQWRVALEQQRVAQAERARAEQRFAEVRRLANTLIFDIHDAVRPLAGSTPVRNTILAEALKYLERLEAESTGDEALQIELAKAYARIGDVQGDSSSAHLGEPAEAIRSYTRAESILRPAATAPGASFDVMLAYAQICAGAAQVTAFLPERDAKLGSRGKAAEALRLGEALLRRSPTHDEVRRLVARANTLIAGGLDPPESLPYLERAAAMLRATLAEQPHDSRRLSALAGVESTLGGHLLVLNEHTRALPHFVRARDLIEAQLAREPNNSVLQASLAFSLANIGLAHAQARSSDLRPGIEALERALAIREALASSDPRNHFARLSVGWTLASLGRTYALAGDLGRALATLERARGLEEQTPNPDAAVGHRVNLAHAWLLVAQGKDRAGDRRTACQAFGMAHQLFVRTVRDRNDPASLATWYPEPRELASRGAAACRDARSVTSSQARQ